MKNIPAEIIKRMKTYPKFYQLVWCECFNVKKGTTATYKDIAVRIKNPLAARAVGTALKKNPFAPIIPCHRVIRSDGKIGGYSAAGGVEMKKRLLIKEGVKF